MNGGALDAGEVARQGIVLGAKLAALGPSKEALPTVAQAWADLPLDEGRMMLAITSTWLSTVLVPKLMADAKRQGVDLGPVLARQLAFYTNGRKP